MINLCFQLIEEFRDLYQSQTTHSRYVEWRSKQIERDLQYVPDKLTEEKEYLQNQAEVCMKIFAECNGTKYKLLNQRETLAFLSEVCDRHQLKVLTRSELQHNVLTPSPTDGSEFQIPVP